jgi:hypothetical protein
MTHPEPGRKRRTAPTWAGTAWRAGRWAAAVAVVLAVLVAAVSWLSAEPLRREMERRMNERLEGYTVTLGGARLRPLAVGLDLRDLVVAQDARPDPPVAHIGRLSATLDWRALLRFRLVADFRLVEPAVYVDRRHVEEEERDEVPVQERGWQDALEAIHPLQINRFSVVDGTLTYVEAGPSRPLQLSHVHGVAGNIRKVQGGDRRYPSPVEVEAVVFGRGRLSLDGHADFLARPHAGVEAHLDLADVDLDYFDPLLRRLNLAVRKGTLSAAGDIEYAPDVRRVELERATIRDADAEWIHRRETAAAEQRRVRRAAEAARQATADPELQLRIGELDIINATLGWRNRAREPSYRVFMSETDINVQNLTNQPRENDTVVRLRGRFMGSGASAGTMTLRPEKHGPDFTLRVAIENTDMRAMNDLLRAHARFDVAEGAFSFYSELSVARGRIDGYVKPLFREVEVGDPEADRDKGLLQKVWERVVQVLIRVLENVPRDEVATVAELSGPLEDPDASTLQVVLNLLRNAFFDAILPGFEREARGRRS